MGSRVELREEKLGGKRRGPGGGEGGPCARESGERPHQAISALCTVHQPNSVVVYGDIIGNYTVDCCATLESRESLSDGSLPPRLTLIASLEEW